jgi:hypothetical protein
MPLSRERPGLFQGRANDQVAWYVVSPTVDPAAEAEQWHSRVAKSNRPLVGRVVAVSLGWLAFLTVFVGTVALVWFIGEQRWPGWPLYCVAASVLGLLGAVVAGLAIPLVGDRTEYVIPSTGTVMQIDDEVATWADDEIAVDDLWALTAALNDFEGAGPDDEWDYEDERWRPSSAPQQALKPLIDEHRDRAHARLTEIAGRLGYRLGAEGGTSSS